MELPTAPPASLNPCPGSLLDKRARHAGLSADLVNGPALAGQALDCGFHLLGDF
jgi:hypothetical protein